MELVQEPPALPGVIPWGESMGAGPADGDGKAAPKVDLQMEAWGPVHALVDICAQALPPGTLVLQAEPVQVGTCVVVLGACTHGLVPQMGLQVPHGTHRGGACTGPPKGKPGVGSGGGN